MAQHFDDMSKAERWELLVRNNEHMRRCDQCKSVVPPDEWNRMRWGIGSNLLCDNPKCAEEMQADFDAYCKEQAEDDERQRQYDEDMGLGDYNDYD